MEKYNFTNCINHTFAPPPPIPLFPLAWWICLCISEWTNLILRFHFFATFELPRSALLSGSAQITQMFGNSVI